MRPLCLVTGPNGADWRSAVQHGRAEGDADPGPWNRS